MNTYASLCQIILAAIFVLCLFSNLFILASSLSLFVIKPVNITILDTFRLISKKYIDEY